jgi:homoserine kinase
VKAFAPATVANLNPRFDFLGCAVDSLVDFVSLTVNSIVQLSQIAMAAGTEMFVLGFVLIIRLLLK